MVVQLVNEGIRPPTLMTVSKGAQYDDFTIHRLYGTGNFSNIFSATYKGHHVALKVVNRKKVERLRKEKDVLMEKHVLSRLTTLRLPCFPRLHGTFKDDHSLYFVMDALDGGELWEDLNVWGSYWKPRAQVLLKQLVHCVRELHAAGIVHRDLKAENLIVDRNQLVLVDFGTALDLTRPDLEGSGQSSRGLRPIHFKHYVGTPHFMAPEAVNNVSTGYETDLWSLGCTIYQILTGNPPFLAPSEFLTYLFSGERQLIFPEYLNELEVDLVSSLVQLRKEDRLGARHGHAPDFDAILSHPYFNGAEESLRPSPVTPKLLEKLSRRLSLGPFSGARKLPVNLSEVEGFPALPEVELQPHIDEDSLLHEIRLLAKEYAGDCMRCGGRRGELPEPLDGSLTGILRGSYCLKCQKTITDEADLDMCIREGLKHDHFTRFYRASLGTREDNYYESLSQRFLKQNPRADFQDEDSGEILQA
ncbi:MAG: uncharacterized protein KVP18_002714 [Porospora cf. gigantea A]|uniref:uncharacterized protein n=2 Tax=Porospora cf. gigantea A TaxID=2853593 RepID=UPI0035593D06|nr:MAG: hypothetical protein KVP18_002714 [Porospora cf. gigantea A]